MVKNKNKKYIRPISIFEDDRKKVDDIENFSAFVRYCVRNPNVLRDYEEYKNNLLI